MRSWNMKNMNTMPKAFMNDPVFSELNDVAQVAALPVKKRKSYERSLKAYRDWYSIIETERAEGIVEGERKMLNANVARMRSNGFSDQDIAKILDQPLDLILSI